MNMDLDCGPRDFGIKRVPPKEGDGRRRSTPHRSGPPDRNARRYKSNSRGGHTMMAAPTGTGLDDIYADDSPREGRPRLGSFGENYGSDTSRFSCGDKGGSREGDKDSDPSIDIDDEETMAETERRDGDGDYDSGAAGSVKSRQRNRKHFRGNAHHGNGGILTGRSQPQRMTKKDRERNRGGHSQYDHSPFGRTGRVRALEHSDPLDEVNTRQQKPGTLDLDCGLRPLQAADARMDEEELEWHSTEPYSTSKPEYDDEETMAVMLGCKKQLVGDFNQHMKQSRRSDKSNATLRRLKAQGNTIDHEWRYDHGGSSNGRKSDRPKKKGKRQTKLLPDTSTSSRRRTRSALRARSSGSEIMTMDSSSSEDEASVTAYGSVTAHASVTMRSRGGGLREDAVLASVTAQSIRMQQRDIISEQESQSQNSKPPASTRSKASQNLSGSGEIEAARRSLATAKKWAASTVDTLKTAEERLREAQKHVSDAKGQAKSAREQVEEAEAFLKSVEQKWEVIDVDDDSDDDLGARATKRQKRGRVKQGPRVSTDALRQRSRPPTPRKDKSNTRNERNIAESHPTRTRSLGDRASIDAVRIAVGKKLFKKGCELSFQLGTRNPYILFSYLDSKGKKTEHSVYLKDDEIHELKYYIDGDSDDAHDIDDAMTVIAFRIAPTEKNNFVKYPNAYDPVESGKLEKRYIVVELRDADEFQAMLVQMREHPLLEVWRGAEAKIPAQDLAKYTKAFVEDNRKEKESRLSVGRRTRSGGANKEKKASENKLLLLTELGGDLLGVEGAAVTGSQVEAEATDQSEDAGGNVSDSKGKSSRTHYITIREDDKDRLSPGQFLNDSLVDFWMRWISRGEPAQADSNVHFFTSHFMTTLKDEGPEAVASWTEEKNINVFKKKLIFVPVNADLHWSLCVVINPGLVANNFDEDISDKEEHSFLLFLDSLKMHSKKLYSKHIRKWLNCEYKRLQKTKLGGTLSPFDESRKRVPLRSPKIPYQENGVDAGVFVCRYAYALYTMRHQKFTWEDVSEKPAFHSLITQGPAFRFGMSDIARIRNEMAKLIDNLSKHYLQMKEEEKAKKRAAKKAGKQSGSTETGEANTPGESSGNEKRSDADMADASSGNEEAGDVDVKDAASENEDATSKAIAMTLGEDSGAPREEVEEAAAVEDADMADASSGKETAGDVDMKEAASREDSGDATGEDPGAPRGVAEDSAVKEGDRDVAISSSEEKEKRE